MAEEEVKKEKKKKCAAGAPAWMVTYSDLVTLLLTFFVLLLSMANMDPVKFTRASSSIQNAFGIPRDPTPVDFTVPVFPSMPITKFTPLQQESTKKIHDKIKNQIKALRINQEVELINKDNDAIILRIDDAILFAPGQSQITPTSFLTLRNIADIVRPLPMSVRIEGHSDDMPVGKSINANWDLSVDRAVSVLRFLVQGKLLEIDRLAAVGYGADLPVVPNTNDENRAKNRRVDFVLRLNPPDATTSENSDIPL